MSTCELCGAEVKEGESNCHRCGFEFPKAVCSDSRDQRILDKYKGKATEEVKRDLRDKMSHLISYFENLDVHSDCDRDLTAFIEEALEFLHVPVAMGIGDELVFNEREETLIAITAAKVEETDVHQGHPAASVRSYVRLANALNSMSQCSRAMEMMDKALLKEPNNTDALFGKAKLVFYEKRYEESKRYLAKLLKKDKNHQKAQYLAEMVGQLIGE